EQCTRLVFTAGHVVDLEPELDRQAALPRLHDRVDVRLEVIDAALRLVGLRPERAQLREVVAVLRKADLVDSRRPRRVDERLDRPRVVRDLLAPVAQVHVVVDDHNRAATRSRSSASVTLSSRGSPSTLRTRPPAASTAAEQSVHSEPASAFRNTSATNALGRSAPSLSPLPAAARTAQTLTSTWRAPLSSAWSSLRASARASALSAYAQRASRRSSTRPSPASPTSLSSCDRPCRRSRSSRRARRRA